MCLFLRDNEACRILWRLPRTISILDFGLCHLLSHRSGSIWSDFEKCGAAVERQVWCAVRGLEVYRCSGQCRSEVSFVVMMSLR